MYSAFLKPNLEYGSTLFMGATPTHLSKLYQVQATMERIGGYKDVSLPSRAEQSESLYWSGSSSDWRIFFLYSIPSILYLVSGFLYVWLSRVKYLVRVVF